MKIAVVYWSGTGNTEAMAMAVANGAKQKGADVKLSQCSSFNASDVQLYDAFAFGCPAMGAEELEDSEFIPMFDACKSQLSGKPVVLFGSYGWGDGEWMRTWEEDCISNGIKVVGSYICNEAPDDSANAECEALGAKLIV